MPVSHRNFTRGSAAHTTLWQPEIRLPDNATTAVFSTPVAWSALPADGSILSSANGEWVTEAGNIAVPWACAFVFARSNDSGDGTVTIGGYNQFGVRVTETVEIPSGGGVLEFETQWCYGLIDQLDFVKGAGTTTTLNISAQQNLNSENRTSYFALPAKIKDQADILDVCITDDTGVAENSISTIASFVGEPYYKIALTNGGLNPSFDWLKLFLKREAVGL